VLRHDDREQRLLQRVGLPLQGAEAVPKDVRVLRRVGDEAALGQLRRVHVIRRVIDLGIGHVLRAPLQPVLADHDRPPLARLDVLGQKQNAVSNHVRENVEHDFVASVFRLVVNLSRAGISGGERQVEAADDFVVEVLAIGLGTFLVGVERGVVHVLEGGAADVFRFTHQLLRVLEQLVELPLLPVSLSRTQRYSVHDSPP
jgi:hypothetical protein